MSNIEQAAALLVAVRRGEQPRPAALPAALAPAGETDAYAIQHAVLEKLGERIAGWKASMPDAHHGTSAPVTTGSLLPSPARVAALVAATRDTTAFGIEPEIVFRMREDLPPLPQGRSYTREAVLAAVATVHAGIEICVTRFVDFNAAPPFDRLADAIMNEGLVLGPGTSDWSSLPLDALPLRVSVDDATVHQGVGGHPIGDPVIPLVWVANHLAQRGLMLRKGEVVTTGSCNGIRHVPRGARVTATFGPLGAAQIAFH